jgi:hypothetical protein
MEASNIPDAQKSMTCLEQCEGDTECFFFNYHGVVHYEYAPLGQTVIKEYYQLDLSHLHYAVRCKRPELWDARHWQLHHENTPDT